jgi:heme exporter protein D
MGGFGVVDAVTWQALGLALTVVGLLASVVVWRRRGATSGLRAVAWSLLPLAAGLTGVLRLFWQIGVDIAAWAVRVVLSPIVWLGVVVAGVSLVLFVVTGVLRAKGVGRRSRREPAARKPEVTSTGAPAATSPADEDDDLADVQAILKRHGIS